MGKNGTGWIAVDLDGTLAHYDKWHGADHIGEPIPLMLKRVKQWRAEGKEVRIFTARVSHDGTEERVRDALVAHTAITIWCEKHIGEALPITNIKDYEMIEQWDDRAVEVVKNTGKTAKEVEYLRGVENGTRYPWDS